MSYKSNHQWYLFDSVGELNFFNFSFDQSYDTFKIVLLDDLLCPVDDVWAINSNDAFRARSRSKHAVFMLISGDSFSKFTSRYQYHSQHQEPLCPWTDGGFPQLKCDKYLFEPRLSAFPRGYLKKSNFKSKAITYQNEHRNQSSNRPRSYHQPQPPFSLLSWSWPSKCEFFFRISISKI